MGSKEEDDCSMEDASAANKMEVNKTFIPSLKKNTENHNMKTLLQRPKTYPCHYFSKSEIF